MRRWFFQFTLVFISVFGTSAAVPQLFWQRGNQFYNSKQYDSAVYYYEQVRSLQPRDAVVCYNLGNAYYRLNDIPRAILNYERALAINGEYRDARDNLAVARSRMAGAIAPAREIFFIRWWHSLTAPHDERAWSVAAVVVFLIIIGLLSLRRLSASASAFLPRQLIPILFSCWAMLLLLAFVSAGNMRPREHKAVVMVKDAPLMGDDKAGKPLLLLPAGTLVEVSGTRQGWVGVALPDGRKGWVDETAIAPL